MVQKVAIDGNGVLTYCLVNTDIMIILCDNIINDNKTKCSQFSLYLYSRSDLENEMAVCTAKL